MDNNSLGIEQARATLPSLVAEAQGGRSRVITKHGKPVAMLVPIAASDAKLPAAKRTASLTLLRGTGRGLWGTSVGRTIDKLRDEWR